MSLNTGQLQQTGIMNVFKPYTKQTLWGQEVLKCNSKILEFMRTELKPQSKAFITLALLRLRATGSIQELQHGLLSRMHQFDGSVFAFEILVNQGGKICILMCVTQQILAQPSALPPIRTVRTCSHSHMPPHSEPWESSQAFDTYEEKLLHHLCDWNSPGFLFL